MSVERSNYMNKAYIFSEGKVKSNSISVIYVPKT